MNYFDFFERLTSKKPFPYQADLAEEPWPDMIDVPTGLGKTAAVIIAWIWKRLKRDPSNPRRLIYCLPTRVLVEQVHDSARKWCQGASSDFEKAALIQPSAHILMGGNVDARIKIPPEASSILVGTQDMLLSRALNRGYAMNRYKWPVHFALTNNDCLWVYDETQLMGVGVETSAQLDSFRQTLKTFGPARSIWMSATLASSQIETVDHPQPKEGWQIVRLKPADFDHTVVGRRTDAKKRLARVGVPNNERYADEIADLVIERHRGGLTLVIVNRVARAQEIYLAISARAKSASVGIVHSRFRRSDRSLQESLLLSNGDRIIVATQAVEAGVDVSARTLLTELAPWPSLVQRFGRCNRYGEYDDAEVHWIDLEVESEETLALPYTADSLAAARDLIRELNDAGPVAVRSVSYKMSKIVRPVIRRRDFLDLFDTSPDLSGNDVDVSRFVRDDQDTDIQFFWRHLEADPQPNVGGPTREELCRVSLANARDFIGALSRRQRRSNEPLGPWRWNALERRWDKSDAVRAGQVILLGEGAGGYDSALGWTGDLTRPTPAVDLSAPVGEDESFDADPDSCVRRWVRLDHHLEHVRDEATELAEALCLSDTLVDSVATAGLWHDVGKAHEVFQRRLLDPVHDRPSDLPEGDGPWAKSSHHLRSTDTRPHFRHELASALAWLAAGPEREDRDLIAYLVAAHHGKVRLSIRSLPGEREPDGQCLFARGVWDGDEIAPLMIPGSGMVGPIRLDLSCMRLGRGSWLERSLRLRDSADLGPIRLAMLETLVRLADWRASAKEERGEYDH